MNTSVGRLLSLCLGLCFIFALTLLPNRARAAAPVADSRQAPFFIENVGQFSSDVRYRFVGGTHSGWITDDAVIFDSAAGPIQIAVPSAGWQAATPLATRIHFYTEGGPFLNVPVWRTVAADGVTLTGVDGRLAVAATAPLDVSAAQPLHIADGMLRLGDTIVPLPDAVTPLVWRTAESRYTQPARAAGEAVGDSELPVLYGTFIGGSSVEEANAIAVDATGHAVVGGLTQSTDYLTTTAGLAAPEHGVDLTVSRVTPDGTGLDYAVWINFDPLQPDDEDHGLTVAVDDAGNAYFGGWTRTSGLCAEAGDPPGYDTTHNGGDDGFILRLTPDGVVDYCSFLGSADTDWIRGLTLDGSGAVVVTGFTWSDAFPHTFGAYGGQSDLFVARLVLNGDAGDLIWSGLRGGSGNDSGIDVAVDGSGRTVATGFTFSNNFPTTANAFDATYNGDTDIVHTVVNAAGNNFTYASYIGGNWEDRPFALDVDAAGNSYVTGRTYSTDFPLAGNPLQDSLGSNFVYDAFVARLDSSGGYTYGSYFGGTGQDEGNAILALGDGAVLLAGMTQSADFPVTEPGALNGNSDAFLHRLVLGEPAPAYGAFVGGSAEETANAVALGPNGGVFVAGDTRSADFPVSPDAFDTTLNGDYDAFILRTTAGINDTASLAVELYSRDGADFIVKVTLTNNSSWTIEGWTLAFESPHLLTDDYFAQLTALGGGLFSVMGPPWNLDLEPGETIMFGLGGTLNGGGTADNCTLNGAPCVVNGTFPAPLP